MKKSGFLLCCAMLLSACVSEPIDPSFKGSDAVDRQEAAKTRVSLGLTYLKNGNYAQAKSNLDRALQFDPRSSDAHFAMAYYYQQVDETKLAEQYYESALDLSNDNPDIVNSYGVFLCQQGKYNKAKEYFLDAVNAQNYAATAETYENLAICTQSQGDTAGAINYFNSALNHQPTRSSTLLMLTDLYVEQGQWDDAKKKLSRYERTAPVSAESLHYNYLIAKGRGDVQQAIGYGNLLMRNYPEHEYTKEYMSNTGKFKLATNSKVKQKTLSSLPETPSAVSQSDNNSNTVSEPESSVTASKGMDEEPMKITVRKTLSIDNDVMQEVVEIKEGVEEKAADTTLALSDVEAEKNEETSASDNIAISVDTAQTANVDETVSDLAEKNQVDSSAVDSEVVDNMVTDLTIDPGEGWHIVQKKENLYRISVKYNVSMAKLMEWNGLEDASDILWGTRMRVKEPSNDE